MNSNSSDSRRRPPLKARLQAWWEGYDVADIGAGPEDAEVASEPTGAPLEAEPEAVEYVRHTVAEGWCEARIVLNEMMWGEGYIGPGGDEYVTELLIPLGLTKEHSVIEVGAGLGGATRCITRTTGAWVAGYESDPVLARAAMERSTRHGVAKKAVINLGDLADIKVRKHTIDCVFAKEGLLARPDTRQLFEKFHTILKVEGHLLFTDLFTAGEGSGVAAPGAAGEPPWSVAATRAALESLGFDVRVTEDITANYREWVVKQFRKVLDAVSRHDADPETTSWAMAEAEHWTRRVAALEAGEIKAIRVYARVPLG